MSEIMEKCLYNSNILCGGVVERLDKCWRCAWNPTVQYERRKAKTKTLIALTAPDQPESDSEKAKPLDPEKAFALYKQGLNDRMIAEQLGVGVNAVFRWRKKTGLTANRIWGHRDSDEEGPDINYHPYHRVDIDYSLAPELYSKGLSDARIAAEIGCCEASIARWRHRNNLPPSSKVIKEEGGQANVQKR